MAPPSCTSRRHNIFAIDVHMLVKLSSFGEVISPRVDLGDDVCVSSVENDTPRGDGEESVSS